MLLLYNKGSTDESICYGYTLEVQRMGRYAMVIHLRFNRWVDMLWFYIRGSTDESICYDCTLERFNGWVDMLWLYIRGSTDELICYGYTLEDLQHLQAILQDLQHLQAILQDLQHLQTILNDLQEMQSAQTCKHLREKISVLKATMNMHMHPEQNTVNSDALLHEVLNEIEKLDLE
nr:hypothetical protein [Tanacetum cinerariifolium]